MTRASKPSTVDNLLGLEEVRDIARSFAAGEISSREEAINQAVAAMLEARFQNLPEGVVERTSTAVAQTALEDPAMRERIGTLLDLLAAEEG